LLVVDLVVVMLVVVEVPEGLRIIHLLQYLLDLMLLLLVVEEVGLVLVVLHLLLLA
jgi:hypothetical protein